jgi:hypothetical protein
VHIKNLFRWNKKEGNGIFLSIVGPDLRSFFQRNKFARTNGFAEDERSEMSGLGLIAH